MHLSDLRTDDHVYYDHKAHRRLWPGNWPKAIIDYTAPAVVLRVGKRRVSIRTSTGRVVAVSPYNLRPRHD